MKLKLKTILLSAATLGLAATPVLTATSCSSTDSSTFFTITNNKGLSVEFCDYGASIYSMKYKDTYLTYHQQDKDAFMNKQAKTYFHGKTLGRVTGRFKDGKMKFDGLEYQLEVNEKSTTKNNCLHGGTNSFVFRNFKHWIYENELATKVVFNYFSPAMEAGFPEAVDAWVVYTLYKEQNRLDTDLYAVPTGKTVINMCTHPLFRLANEGNVLDYTLKINTDTRVKYVDEDSATANGQIPEQWETANTIHGTGGKAPFDFQAGKRIGEHIEEAKKYDPVSGGYDHIWAFKDTVPIADRYVQLTNPANKISLKVTARSKNITGVILYANDFPLKDTKMQDGKDDTVYAGITIEPYTYFTSDDSDPTAGKVGLGPITYDQNNPFYNAYSYEVTQEE